MKLGWAGSYAAAFGQTSAWKEHRTTMAALGRAVKEERECGEDKV